MSPRSLRVGFFLASRQIRADLGTSTLIIVVMALTYLNLLVVSGLLVGIVQGLNNETEAYYSGDIILTNYQQNDSIPNSPDVISYLKSLPSVASISPRYIAQGAVEANYADITGTTVTPDTYYTTITGVDPAAENETTHLSDLVIQGQYLQPGDYNEVLVGSSLLAGYKTLVAVPGSTPLPNVAVGSRIRIVVNGVTQEVTVKGVIASKVENVDLRVFMIDSQLRDMLGRTDGGVNEIAVKLAPDTDAAAVQQQIVNAGIGTDAKVQLSQQAEPTFFQDFETTFNQLGTVLGGVALVVAFIAIFILVFINTIMRRRFIGILQAIGIGRSSIEIAYVLQSMLYAIIGAGIGMLVLFFVLEPLFAVHPINFPFSNGILTVTLSQALAKAGVLVVAIILASFIPARMIMRQEIVDAMLGR